MSSSTRIAVRRLCGRPLTVGGAVAASGAAAYSAASPTEARADDSAAIMGAALATTVVTLIASEYAIQVLDKDLEALLPSKVAGKVVTTPQQQPSTSAAQAVEAAAMPAAVPAAVTVAVPARADTPPAPPPAPTPALPPTPAPPTAPTLLSIWPVLVGAAAVMGGAYAVRKRGRSDATQVARPLAPQMQTSVTVRERQALRRAFSKKWYSALPARLPGQAWAPDVVGAVAAPPSGIDSRVQRGDTPASPESPVDPMPRRAAAAGSPMSRRAATAGSAPTLSTAAAAAAAVAAAAASDRPAGLRVPQLWTGQGNLQSVSAGAQAVLPSLDYSGYALRLPSLVGQRGSRFDLSATLAALPTRGEDRATQLAATAAVVVARPAGPRTPQLQVEGGAVEKVEVPSPPLAAAAPIIEEEDLSKLTVVELKARLKEHGAMVKGKKADLIERLSAILAAAAAVEVADEATAAAGEVAAAAAVEPPPPPPAAADATPPATPPPPPPVASSTSTSTPTPTATATLRDLADALAAQRGTLAALFAEVDADGSVSLDKEELRDMITHRLGVNLADEEMGTVWRQLDADGSVRRACLLL